MQSHEDLLVWIVGLVHLLEPAGTTLDPGSLAVLHGKPVNSQALPAGLICGDFQSFSGFGGKADDELTCWQGFG
jgi:hypothetical protein